MGKVVITLDENEVELVKMIVNDDDKDDALAFVKDVLYRKMNDDTRERKCGPKH